MRKIALLLLLSFGINYAATVSAYGKAPAPPDNSEKGFVATTLALYSKFKSIVKWANRSYLAYKSVNYTFKEIEYWLTHFDDYWANVYDKFESATKYLEKGDIANAIFSLEDMFQSVDAFFIVEVKYMDYLLTRDLTKNLISNEAWATDNSYENALRIIEAVYDNTKNIRSITGMKDKDRSRPSFEWYMFTSSQAMQNIGRATEKMKDIKLKIDEFKDLNSSLQTMGENLAQQKLILMSLYELEMMEYQLSINDLETNRNALADINNDIYRGIHAKGADLLAVQAIADNTAQINPYERAIFINNHGYYLDSRAISEDLQ